MSRVACRTWRYARWVVDGYTWAIAFRWCLKQTVACCIRFEYQMRNLRSNRTTIWTPVRSVKPLARILNTKRIKDMHHATLPTFHGLRSHSRTVTTKLHAACAPENSVVIKDDELPSIKDRGTFSYWHPWSAGIAARDPPFVASCESCP